MSLDLTSLSKLRDKIYGAKFLVMYSGPLQWDQNILTTGVNSGSDIDIMTKNHHLQGLYQGTLLVAILIEKIDL